VSAAATARLVVACAALTIASARPSAAAEASCGWLLDTPPSRGVTANQLQGVWAAAWDDVWSWGTADDRMQLAHRDGTGWRTVANAAPFGPGSHIESLRGLSARDVWAVGYMVAGDRDLPLVAHYDGLRWRAVASPPIPRAAFSQVLFGVVPIAANSVYAAGSTCASDWCHALLEHFDGVRWTIQNESSPGYNTELATITASSAANVWAGGDSVVGFIERLAPATQTWNVVPSEADLGIVSMSAAPSGEVWAVGNPGITSDDPVERWSGVAWQSIPFGGTATLTGVDATGQAVWVVGTDTSRGAPTPLALQFGAKGWVDKHPIASPTGASLAAVAAVPGSLDAWAVGSVGYQLTRNLVEHYWCPLRRPR
jgi:hypothetical protein